MDEIRAHMQGHSGTCDIRAVDPKATGAQDLALPPQARDILAAQVALLGHTTSVNCAGFVASAGATHRLPDRAAVITWARPRLATLDHEELWALCLDGRHGLRAARRVASGGIHGLHVGVRDVLRLQAAGRRHPNRKLASMVRSCTSCLDGSSMHLDQTPGNRESYPQSGPTSHVRRTRLGEQVEYPRQHRSRYSLT